MTRITETIMTQTMTPAKNRSRTMKIKLTTMAITRPLQQGAQSCHSHFLSTRFGRNLHYPVLHCWSSSLRLTAGSNAKTECSPQRSSWPPGELQRRRSISCEKRKLKKTLTTTLWLHTRVLASLIIYTYRICLTRYKNVTFNMKLVFLQQTLSDTNAL